MNYEIVSVHPYKVVFQLEDCSLNMVRWAIYMNGDYDEVVERSSGDRGWLFTFDNLDDMTTFITGCLMYGP